MYIAYFPHLAAVKQLMKQRVKAITWIAVGTLAGALATMSVQSVARNARGDLPLEEMQRFARVFETIKGSYVETVDEKKLINDAIKGMVTSLDPHSSYFDAKGLKEFNEGVSGSFVGLGIEITQEDGYVKIVSPIEGTPAYRAGLKSGDLITKIDDVNVRTLSLNESVKRMRGEPNTQVRLSIERKAESRSFTVTITRELIKTISVKSKMIEPGYGWVRVTHFQERTVQDFTAQVTALYKQDPKMKGLVLDLRNDPGGYLHSAAAILSAFFDKPVTVVSTKGQMSGTNETMTTAPGSFPREDYEAIAAMSSATRNMLHTIPVVVLVNEGSASASEIVAGALQDLKRATLIGNQTFGKGSVQTAVCLDEGNQSMQTCQNAGLKLTISRYYTPSGKSIQAKGIVPDYFVDESESGDPFAILRYPREADYLRHISNGQGSEIDTKALDQEREAARKRMEAEACKPEDQRYKSPDLGSDKDFQLLQAIAKLQGKPVAVSKALMERKESKNTDAEDGE